MEKLLSGKGWLFVCSRLDPCLQSCCTIIMATGTGTINYLPFREVWVYWSMKNSRRRWITVYLVHVDLVTFEFSHFVVLPIVLL